MYWWAQLRNSLWRSAGTVFSLMLIFVWIQTPKEILQSWCEAGSLPEALPMPVTLMQPRCLSISQGVSKLCPFPLNFLGSWKFQGTQDCWFALKSLLSLCLSLSLNAVLLLSLSSLSLSLSASVSFSLFYSPSISAPFGHSSEQALAGHESKGAIFALAVRMFTTYWKLGLWFNVVYIFRETDWFPKSVDACETHTGLYVYELYLGRLCWPSPPPLTSPLGQVWPHTGSPEMTRLHPSFVP